MARTISTLIGKPDKWIRIKDYSKVDHIFNLYLSGQYDTMAREIYFYRVWDFFVDLAKYLHGNYNNRELQAFFHGTMWDEFSEREDTVFNEMIIRKERKKYRL